MRRFLATLTLLSILTMVTSLANPPSRATAQSDPIKSVTAITKVFGEGQKIIAAAVEYDQAIDNSKLTQSAFAVESRTITNVYANTTAAMADEGVNGRYVIIELSPDDADAATFVGGKGPGSPPSIQEAKISVTQVGDVTTADGTAYAADANAVTNDKVINLVVDDFQQLEFKDAATGITLKYNLYIPKNYDKNKSYPLILFIHDASLVSDNPLMTLAHGLGAVIWATPSEQAKHEAFVLAPQYTTVTANDNSETTPDLDATVNLIKSLESQYNIDQNRLYTTGQSMGGMSSIALLIKYPDMFAGAMLVACQWDATKVAPLAKDKLWIIVSEGDAKAFPGMNAITAALEKEGAKISRATWNAQATPEEFAADVSPMIAEDSNIKYTAFVKGTTNGGDNEHMSTWPIAYTIEGVRDWLFAQTKADGGVTDVLATTGAATGPNMGSQLAPGPCGAISRQDFAGIPGAPTVLASTAIVSATAQSPEYCKVTGMIAPQIQFELDLPTADWNGRYLQSGCGGYCGSVRSSEECTAALARNYAVGFNNTGHTGGGGDSMSFWAHNEPGLRADFGYLSEHKMSLAAKAIIEAFYGQPVDYAYFFGCSNGGRQALQEAQRWPEDFDGIIAGAPAAIQAPLNGVYHAWNALVNQDEQDNPVLTADKLPLIHEAVLAQCGQQDGLDEPYLTDPRACDFKPESLLCQQGDDTSQCLTEAEVTLVKKVYSGPVDDYGQHLYVGGEALGTELKWAGAFVPNSADEPAGGFEQIIAGGYLKYLAFKNSPGASFNLNDWGFTVDHFNSLREMGSVYNATNPNLAPFRDAGGKLILYHGWADDSIPPLGTVAYYQAVQDTMGGLEATQEFARLFMVPGMYHCSGGPGATSFDMLPALEDWVENGVAPEKIIATQYAGDQQGGGFANPTEGGTNSGEVIMTRPLFPYPLSAQYDGQGDPTKAESFVPVTTPGGADGHYDWVGNDLFQ